MLCFLRGLRDSEAKRREEKRREEKREREGGCERGDERIERMGEGGALIHCLAI